MRLAVALSCALLCLALSGCSGGGDDDGPGFVTPPQDEGARYVITLTSGRTFEPENARVPVDSIVVFESELEGCDVRSQETGGPNSHNGAYSNGLLPKGGEYSWFAPSEAATFHVYCTLHEGKGMTGVLRVE